jgi:hypothetical protein
MRKKEVTEKVLRRHPCPLLRQTLVTTIDNHLKALFGSWMMNSAFDNKKMRCDGMWRTHNIPMATSLRRHLNLLHDRTLHG